jgi:hypothetical protein
VKDSEPSVSRKSVGPDSTFLADGCVSGDDESINVRASLMGIYLGLIGEIKTTVPFNMLYGVNDDEGHNEGVLNIFASSVADSLINKKSIKLVPNGIEEGDIDESYFGLCCDMVTAFYGINEHGKNKPLNITFDGNPELSKEFVDKLEGVIGDDLVINIIPSTYCAAPESKAVQLKSVLENNL